MLEVEQVFDMICLVTDIRHRTFDVQVTGRSTTPTPHDIFVAQLTPIMVSRTGRQSIEIPLELRQRLESYQAQPNGK
jgi:acyl-CoA thioester hydrolase